MPVARRTGASIPQFAPSSPLPPFLLARVTRNWLCVTGGRQRLARSARPRPPPLPPPALAPPLQFRPLLALLAAHPPSSLLRGVRAPVLFPFFFLARWRTPRQPLARPLRPAARWTRPRRPSRSRCGGVFVAALSALRARAAAAAGRPAAPRAAAARHHACPPRVTPPRHRAPRLPAQPTVFLGYATAAKLKAKSGGSRGAAPRWTREVGRGIKTPVEAIKVRFGASRTSPRALAPLACSSSARRPCSDCIWPPKAAPAMAGVGVTCFLPPRRFPTPAAAAPPAAAQGTYIDKKCPWTGNVSIRGRILKGVVVSTKMARTIVLRRDYLRFISKCVAWRCGLARRPRGERALAPPAWPPARPRAASPPARVCPRRARLFLSRSAGTAVTRSATRPCLRTRRRRS